MSKISKLFEYLNSNTSDQGSWTLYFNQHKIFYEKNPLSDYADQNKEKLISSNPDVDFSGEKDFYELVWHDLTPVGSYTFYANSLEQLAEKIII